MSGAEKDGGYAFPAEYRHDGEPWGHPGMTLRDWFASQCDQPGEAEIITAAGLQAKTSFGSTVILENGDEQPFSEWWKGLGQTERFRLYAKVRYAIADAMLKERSK